MATTPRPGASGANRATRRSTAKSTAKKRPAAKKATADVSDLSEKHEEKNPALFTLEDLEAEVDEIPDVEPFTLAVGEDENGEPDIITIGHPGDVPFALATGKNLDAIFSYAMSDEDWEKFVDAGLTTSQAGVAFVLWRKHYGMGTQGE
ncbi:UNVERIFIED_CONTAM: hypothetical protein IGO34_23090 [Salmonella enterica subsp. enterica serovar Weltevreden]